MITKNTHSKDKNEDQTGKAGSKESRNERPDKLVERTEINRKADILLTNSKSLATSAEPNYKHSREKRYLEDDLALKSTCPKSLPFTHDHYSNREDTRKILPRKCRSDPLEDPGNDLDYRRRTCMLNSPLPSSGPPSYNDATRQGE